MKRDQQSVASRVLGAMNTAPVRVLVLVVLFTAAAVREAFHLSAVLSPDVWWHVRTGLWIVQNHTAPHNGLFSQYPWLPWTASNWGYDILLAAAYKVFGLRSLPLASMTLQVLVAVAVYLLARGSRQSFWPAVFLSACAQYAFASVQPQPISCSIILFALELALLLRSRRSADVRRLLWLPLVFVAWANLHTTFTYGLLVVVLLLVTVAVEEICCRSGLTFLEGHVPAMPVLRLAAVTAGCVIASTFTPYTYRTYGAALKTVTSSAYHYVGELHAMNFRQPQDYVLLLLAMAVFVALGRLRSRDLFTALLMIFSLTISFAAQRDRWVVVLVAVAVMADALSSQHPQTGRQSEHGGRWEPLFTAGLTLVVVVTAAAHIPSGRELLLTKTADRFPVQAADYIRQNKLPQPLFNDYQWGSFLTWYLPEYPVAIDSRTDLYGDELNVAYSELINGYISLEANPSLARARTVLIKRHSGMSNAIASLPQFRVVYSDELASVLVRNN
jgi:hypothetical protein